MPSWPAALPRPTFNGYAVNPADQILRTDMEVGAPRSRRRTLARNDKIDVRWIFTDSQMAVFRAWFDGAEYAAGGSAWFTVDLAVGDGGIRNVEARFAGVPKPAARSGLLWDVTAQLETRGGELTADQIRATVLGLVSGSNYPSLVLDFIGNEVLDKRISFVRSTTATRVNGAGLIELVAVNTPRFDYAVATRLPRGLLMESARTNLILNSDIEGAVGGAVTSMVSGGTGLQIPVVSNTVWIGPNQKCARHTRDTANGDTNIGTMYFTALPSKTYTASIWCYVPAASPITGPVFTVETANASGGASINLALRDQWQRISFLVVSTGSFVAGDIALVLHANTHLGVMYSDAWQVEEGDFSTSYIPTASTAVTRSADVLGIYGLNFSGFYNPLESTLLVKLSSNKYPTVTEYDAAVISDGSGNNRIVLRVVGGATQSIDSIIISASITQVDSADNAAAEYISHTHAVGFKVNDFAESLNGGAIGVDSSLAMPSVDRLTINGNAGHFERLVYYPVRLSNAELQRLSGA